MQASTGGAQLGAAVAWASRLCPTRPALPQLGAVLLRADDGGLHLTTTNMDEWARTTVKGVTATPGSALASGRLLAAVTKAAGKAADVQLVTDDTGLTVTAGRSSWTLPTLDHEEFPTTPDLGSPVGALDSADLAAALGRALPAASREPGNPPFYGGVLLTPGDGVLHVFATDRFRMCDVAVPWRASTDDTGDLIVPVDLLELAARAGDAGVLELCTNGQVVSFASTSHQITGRLVAEEVSSTVRNAIPDPDGRPYITADTAELAQAIESARVVAEVEGEPIQLTFDNEESVAVSLAEQGRASATHALLSGIDGDVPERVWFKPQFLLDALKAAHAEQVLVSFGKNERSPVLILPLGEDGQHEAGYRHVLMPVSHSHWKAQAAK